MRQSIAALLFLALAACGATEDDKLEAGPWHDPAACDLRALAQSLLHRSNGCPPASCVIDGANESIECQGQAEVVEGRVCTRFSDPGASCQTFCAPVSCTLSPAGAVHCNEGCSVDHTTCFAVAENLCPGSD